MSAVHLSRRDFLSTSAAASSALLLGGASSARAAEASDEKLRLAIVGVGGRGGANMNSVAGEIIHTLCDVNPGPLAAARKRFPDAKVATDWRTIVDDPAIDGVVISTADHHHALCAIAALRAGKHVYSEKPLAHTVREARLMQAEYKARRGQVATQMGTQIHASDNFRRVVELVQAGAVGVVSEAHVWCSRTIPNIGQETLPEQEIPSGFDWDTWLGPAADRPYNTGYWKGGNLNWNRRWEFGNGVLGDMGSHLIDLPWWALELTHPTSIASDGPTSDPVSCPPWQQVTWEHPARSSSGPQSGAVKVIWYHGPEGMRRRAETLQPLVGKDTEINRWGIGVTFVGSAGVLTADYGRHVLSPSADFADYERPPQSIPKSLGHHAEWLHACKTGAETLCNFDYSGRLIEHNLLGNVAHRAGKKLEYDASSGRVTNDEAANKLLTKSYREGWDPEVG